MGIWKAIGKDGDLLGLLVGDLKGDREGDLQGVLDGDLEGGADGDLLALFDGVWGFGWRLARTLGRGLERRLRR